MGKEKSLTFRIQRYNPDVDDKPTFSSYKVPYTDRQGVLDALHYNFRNLDSSLAYRWNCRTGQCGSCAISINGVPGLACRTIVNPSQDYVLEPLQNFPVVRDLVVDLGPGFRRLEKLRPYLERTAAPDRPEKLTREEISSAMELRSCIECFSCYAGCPAVSSAKQEYPGPIAMRELASFEFDPRDQGLRYRHRRGDHSPGYSVRRESDLPRARQSYLGLIPQVANQLLKSGAGTTSAPINSNQEIDIMAQAKKEKHQFRVTHSA